MQLSILMLAAMIALPPVASAQWTTECVRHTSRLRTCTTKWTPQPAPDRAAADTRSRAAVESQRAELPASDSEVFGVWRASGVRFESHGQSTLLEVHVTPIPGGIHLETPIALDLPGGHAFDLQPAGAMTFRATDRVGRVVTFRVVAHRAELSVTGPGGSGAVTYQLDQHEPPR
jgi:hypothetical protein